MLGTAVGRLRLVSLLEGTSFLVLLFVAMPLKYGMDRPWLVEVTGRIHGGLFVLFLLALVPVAIERGWGPIRAFGAVVVSSLPFGAFWFERQLKKLEIEPAAA